MRFTQCSRRGFVAAAAALLTALPSLHVLAAPFALERITVRTEGAGPDVVLIPGLNSSPRAWASTVAALPGYRHHLMQLSGFAGQPAGANREGLVAAPAAGEIARCIRELEAGVRERRAGRGVAGIRLHLVARLTPDRGRLPA